MALGYTFPIKVPEGEHDCRYRRFGRVGRAARDISRVATSRFGGVLTFAVCPVLTAAALFVVPADANARTRSAVAIGSFVMGICIAASLIFLYGVSPVGRRGHWRVRVSERLQDGNRHLSLTSRHWHRTRNVQCIVTDPKGCRWRAANHRTFGLPEMLYQPGDGPGLSYPRDFVNGRGQGAPAPEPGRYRLRWEMDTEHGPERPVTLATGRWTESTP